MCIHICRLGRQIVCVYIYIYRHAGLGFESGGRFNSRYEKRG